MIRTVFVVLFLFVLLHASAQHADSIVIGKKISLYSDVLGEHRRIWVYEPGNTTQRAEEGKQYPVLYLLDGDAHFYATVGIIQQLSQANGNGVLPEMIVVAIENTNRLRDLTPALPATGDPGKSNPFVRFLSSELIPYVEENFNAAPYRLLVGHSLGGLTAIDILTNHPRLFNAYIAIDPSMWYGNEKFLNHAMTQLPKQRMDGIRLFMATANTMPRGMEIAAVGTDKSAETQHIRSMLKLDQFMKLNTNGLRYAQAFYEKEKHNTVPLLSQYDGLRFIFDYYAIDLSEQDFADTSSRIAQALKTHYAKVSKEMGYPVAAPRTFVSYLGYDALAKKQFRKAEALFQLNREAYPERFEVHEAYADMQAARKDTVAAMASYRKAIALKRDPIIVAKLQALTGQPDFGLTEEVLRKYEGVYTLENYGVDIILVLRNGKLISRFPGQPDSEFLPVAKDLFTVKDKQGYRITFQMNGDKPMLLTSDQPNGVFKAVYKK